MVKWSELNKQFYKSGEMGNLLGLSRKTIFKYTKEGRLKSVRTETERHLYPKEEVARILEALGMLYDDRDRERIDVIYARVSSNEQKKKGDLDRQVVAVLEKAGSLNNPVVLKEVGSGLNDKRNQCGLLMQGLKEALKETKRSLLCLWVVLCISFTRLGFLQLQPLRLER